MLNLEHELDNLDYYKEVINYYKDSGREIDLGLSVGELMDELKNGYRFSKPSMVQIPKSTGGYREVFVFNNKDSFVLRLINKILMTKEFDSLHPNAFAYKKGVRTFNAAKHLQSVLKEKQCYGVKLDIKSYFTSVSYDYLINSIGDLVSDRVGKELLVNLFSINSYVNNDEEIIEEDLGIMPGSALSSFFANWILRDIDEEFSKRCSVYARYSDDLIMFCETKEELEECLSLMVDMLKTKGLEINQSKFKWYDNPNVVDNFLGLNVYPNKIDVSDTGKEALRRLVKSICRKQRQDLESKTRLKKDYSLRYVKKAIRLINKKFYKSIFSVKEKRKSNRISYMFANVTTHDFFKELDFYVLDSLRFVYSGKWNTGSVKELDTKTLESLGFVSSVKMFNLFKIGVDVYLNEVSKLDRHVTKQIYDLEIYRNLEGFRKVTGEVSFLNVLKTLVRENGYILYPYGEEDCYAKVPVSSVVFDIEKKEVSLLISDFIKLHKVTLFKNKTLMVDNIYVLMDDVAYDLGRLPFIENLESSDDLVIASLFSCYVDPTVINERLAIFNKQSRPVYNVNYFRMYSLEEIASSLMEEGLSILSCSEVLKTDVRYSDRLTLFNCMLYSFILTNKDYAGGKKFIRLENKNLKIDYKLILRREWF